MIARKIISMLTPVTAQGIAVGIIIQIQAKVIKVMPSQQIKMALLFTNVYIVRMELTLLLAHASNLHY